MEKVSQEPNIQDRSNSICLCVVLCILLSREWYHIFLCVNIEKSVKQLEPTENVLVQFDIRNRLIREPQFDLIFYDFNF